MEKNVTWANVRYLVSPISSVQMGKLAKMDFVPKDALITGIVLDKMFVFKENVLIHVPYERPVDPTVNVRLETKPSIVAVLKDLLACQLPFKDVSGFPIPVLEKIVQRVTNVSTDSACGNVNFTLIVLEENNVWMACA
jgi:hypothetical protein